MSTCLYLQFLLLVSPAIGDYCSTIKGVYMMPLQQIVVSPVLGVRRKSQKESKESRMVSTQFDHTTVSGTL